MPMEMAAGWVAQRVVEDRAMSTNQETGSTGLTRRRAVAGLAAGSAIAWTTPSVLGLDAVSAATGSVATPATRGDAVFGVLQSGQSLRPTATTWSSNSNFYVFAESRQTLASAQGTDSGMTLPTGVEICAFLIHFSPASGSTTLVGGVNFPGTIVGYDYTDNTLAATDTAWGVNGVTYGVGRRRLELPGNDTLSVTAPATMDMTLFADWRYVDQIRVYVTV